MTTERHHIDVGGIPSRLSARRSRTSTWVFTRPVVACGWPRRLRLDDEAVRLAVVSRLGWIRRQQAEFEQQDRQSQREMVTGESHYFQGRRYLLDVVERGGPPGVYFCQTTRRWRLRVRPSADAITREAVLQRWYREQLRAQIPASVRQVGAKSRQDRRRSAHQENEDALGKLQRRGAAHLAEPRAEPRSRSRASNTSWSTRWCICIERHHTERFRESWSADAIMASASG